MASVLDAYLDLDATCQITWRPVFPFSLIWTPRQSTCGVRSARLSCFGRHLPDYMASVPHAYLDLDANHSVKWRPFLLLFSIWTPPALTAGVQYTLLSPFGRHPLNHTASVLHAYLDLDATCQITWRPLRTTSPFWTPPKLPTGVHSAQLHRFGRHPNFPLASIPHIFPNLDATQTSHWRPFRTSSPIWTPLNSGDGVRSAHLPRFGRHTHNHTASNFAALLKLDATHSITWRPLRTPSPIWTPPTQSHGVRSARLSCFGRHLPDYMASIPHNFPVLDAFRTHRWRPFRTASPIWTPPALTAGVHSCCSSQSGRHTHNHTASNFTALLKLDATQTSHWRPFRIASQIWTPLTLTTGVHSAQLLQSGRHSTRTPASVPAALHNLDATHSITWRPFCTSSPIWTPRQSTCGVQSTLSSPFGRHATSKFNRQYPRNSAKQNRQLPGFP